MKNIYNKLFLLSTLLICSCSESFLDLSPQHQLNGATYFNTEAQFVLATNGAYEALRGLHDRQSFLMGEQRSDHTHYYFRAGERGFMTVQSEEITNFTDTPENNYTNSMYRNSFNGIARVNTILSRINGKNFSENFNKQIVGQAKFLRAYFYFNLVQYYGGVPLHITEVNTPNEAFLPRSSVDQVYAQIIEDVTDAIAKLEPVNQTIKGAATKGAALMLYAKVLMTKPVRDYEKAAFQLKAIELLGYSLETNYEDVFSTSNKNGKESIFEVQYQKGEQGQQSKWLYYFCPFTATAAAITGVANSNATSTQGGWNVPTQELMDSYEPNDLRKNVSIKAAVGTEIGGAFVPKYVLNVGEVCSACTLGDSAVYYFVNKFRHKHEKQDNTDDNWPIYRYADACLLLAECLVHQNKAADALPYLTMVRSRAGLNAVPATLENIANERRHELAFENHRWLDLVRTGKAIEVMTAHGIRQKALHSYLLAPTYKVDANRLLYPIPTRERQINTLLTQNPGYTL